MKGKRLLILGAAFALGLSACANSATLVRNTPLRASGDNYTFAATTGASPDGSWSYVTATNGGNNAPAWNANNSELRLYPKNSITFTASEGITLQSAAFTNKFNTSSGSTITGWSVDNGTITDFSNKLTSFDVTDIGSSSFTITVSGSKGNIGLKTVTIVYSGGSVIPTHTLTYAVGTNGSYNESSTKSFTIVEGNTHTVLSPSAVGISANTGYFFSEWNDGTNNYDPSDSYTMGASDVTLTAQWVAGVALSYNANGGSNAPVTSYVLSGEKQVVASAGNMTAPEGKQFAHWNTKSDDSGDSYNPGTEISNFTSPLTLYAIWENLTHVDFNAEYDKGTGSIVKNDIIMELSSGVLNNGSEYRFYKNATITFTRTSGKIGSIEFTGVSSYAISNLTVTNGGGTLTTSGVNGVWEGAASSVTFTASVAQARATHIVVNYLTGADVDLDKSSVVLAIGGTSTTASISSISGISNPSYLWSRLSGDDCVTLSGETTSTVTISPKGSLISHCVLGLTISGSNLEEPIVREVSIVVGKSSSAETPYSVSEAKRAIDTNHAPYLNGAYVQGFISQIDEFNETYSSITYWISVDGTLEEEQLEVYSGKDVDGADFTAIDNIEVGAEVVVKGNLKKYSTTYEFDKNNEIVTYSVPVLTPEQEIVKLKTQASLSYNYNVQGNGAVDNINKAFTGVTGNSGYPDWSGVNGDSGVVYAGNNYAGANSIQFNASNSSGLVVTANETGNFARKITVEWTDSTAAGRTIGIYASDTPYSSAADLHNTETQGTLIGTIVKGTSTTLEISDEYTYIGIKSQANALNMNSIKIQWGELPTLEFTSVAIRFGGSIDPVLWDDLAGNGDESLVAGYGVAFAKAGSFEGLLMDSIADVENPNGFYKPISAKPDGHPDLVNGNYVWNLYLKISTIKNGAYFEGNIDDDITAVAYIKLTNGTVVFLKEETTSVKALAQGLVDEYEEGFLDGSLDYLANL